MVNMANVKLALVLTWLLTQ